MQLFQTKTEGNWGTILHLWCRGRKAVWCMGLIVLQYSNMLFEVKRNDSVIHPNSCLHGDNGTSLWQHLGRRYENESWHY